MTNQEAIKTTKQFIADLEASDIPIYADEREALETLIQTAKGYENISETLNKVAKSVGGHGGYIANGEDIIYDERRV